MTYGRSRTGKKSEDGKEKELTLGEVERRNLEEAEHKAEEASKYEKGIRKKYQTVLVKWREKHIQRIEELIEEEKKDAKKYRDVELPEQFKRRLLDIAADEEKHARTLQEILYEIKTM